MSSSSNEPENIVFFRGWFDSKGGTIHPNVYYQQVDTGFNIIAKDPIPEDAEIVSCPFDLVITPKVSRDALLKVLQIDGAAVEDIFKGWTETQLMCTYMAMHSIAGDNENLRHTPYLSTLPSPSRLFTPLHFTSTELSLFQGSNLYSATLDRQHIWQGHHAQCQSLISSINTSWGNLFTWEKYLTAATYISSRAFPSTLMNVEPSLVATKESFPILLPGVDALNHARAKPVSWIISHPSPTGDVPLTRSKISLVLHTSTPANSELFNNYGPKPNAELILGYGFTLENNPDDTIVLKIGGAKGSQGQDKWEVGREVKGIDPVWKVIVDAVHEQSEEDEEVQAEDGVEVVNVEDELDASDMLARMAGSLLEKLPPPEVQDTTGVRLEVATMLRHYIEGQRDILQSIIHFAREKEQRALQLAKEQGLDIVAEDPEDAE